MKRSIDKEEDSEQNIVKRHQSPLPPPLQFWNPAVIREFHEPGSYLSVCPRDICTHLSRFFRRYAPKVKDPMALKFVTSVATLPHLQQHKTSCLQFDHKDNLVMVNLKKVVQTSASDGLLRRQILIESCRFVMNMQGRFYATVSGTNDVHIFDIGDAVEVEHFTDSPTHLGLFHICIGNKEFVLARWKAKLIPCGQPTCLALSLDEDSLYVASSICPVWGFDVRVMKQFRLSDTAELLEFGERIIKDDPGGVAVLSTGQIAVSSACNIFIFGQDGALLKTISAHPHEEFRQMAVDADDRLYVPCLYWARIAVFAVDGTVLARVANQGEGSDYFVWPVGVAIDNKGRVAMMDTNDRLLFFACE